MLLNLSTRVLHFLMPSQVVCVAASLQVGPQFSSSAGVHALVQYPLEHTCFVPGLCG